MSKSKEINQNSEPTSPEEPPAEAVHQLPMDEQQLERARLSKEKAIDFIRGVQEHPSFFVTNFELDLAKVGLLSELEAAGVLPPSPAPGEIESASSQPAATERENALKNIYIGTILGHLFDELFSPR